MYRLIDVELTQDDWYLSLDPIDKCIYLNMIISNMTNPLGVIKNGLRLLSFTVGISVEELESRLENLKERVLYIKESNIIYIKGFYSNQAGSQKNSSFFILVKKKFEELPEDIQRLIAKFDQSLAKDLELEYLIQAAEPTDTLVPPWHHPDTTPVPPCIHPGTPLVPPPYTVTDTVTVTEYLKNIKNKKLKNKNILNFSLLNFLDFYNKQLETKKTDISTEKPNSKDITLIDKPKEDIPSQGGGDCSMRVDNPIEGLIASLAQKWRLE